ncbi:MAG TPA: CHAT domain-containing protein, partial [Polyangiaceae bacterium]
GLQHVRNRGDELDGFARAILLAGARSAVLGLWKLDQASSCAFFGAFYRELSRGRELWRALHGAQRELLASPHAAWHHPYHWAPYYLIGDWSPL